jgi:hypothetical protein
MLRLVFVPVLLLAFLLNACTSVRKQIETGDYDGAVERSVRKLQGRKHKDPDAVHALEWAFSKATERDMRAIDHLKAEGRSENWVRIHQIHQQIATRQQLVAPLLPLMDKKGYKATFMFVNIEPLERESRLNAAEHLYQLANEQLAAGRNGDKQAARNAWYNLQDLGRRYFQVYKDKDVVMREARTLGTDHILFEVRNQSPNLLPRSFKDRILAFSQRDFDSDWKAYHFEEQSDITPDYRVVFNLRQLDISPERVHERTYVDEKEIQDGWDYELDDRGNVRKDTLGNDIKYPRHVIIRAAILEVYQTKAARVGGTVDIYDRRDNRIESRPIATDILFEHYASTFSGDARALSDQSRCRIGNSPLPFPLDEAMLVQAADNLKPLIRVELRRNL